MNHYRLYPIILGGLFMFLLATGALDDRLQAQNDQERMLFASNRDGNWEIYVMNADGSEQTNLTNNPSGDTNPSWSPDGSKIAFTSWRDGNSEIYVMNADGSEQTNLTNNPSGDTSPSWSPDGSQIIFQSYRYIDSDIFIMNADGSNVKHVPASASNDSNPRWSPDGTRIVYDTDRNSTDLSNLDIYVMNIDGSNQIQLTDNPQADWAPAWSPDGSQIAYTSRDTSGATDIMVMNVDGSGKLNLTNDRASDAVPAWSPDGTRIAFGSWRDENHDIYTIGVDGSELSRITSDAALDTSPDWSNESDQSNPEGDPDLEVHPILVAQDSQAQVTSIEIAIVNNTQHAAGSGEDTLVVETSIMKEGVVAGSAYATVPRSAMQAETTFPITQWCDASVSSSCQPFDFLPLFAAPGFYTVSATVDAADDVAETDENNNEMFVSFFVGDTPAAQSPLPAPIAPDASNVEHVGSTGGGVYFVTVIGSFAYIGEGHGLTILDVSNPAAPVFRSHMPLNGHIEEMQVVGDLAYIAAGDQGLLLIDVSNPDNPTLRGHKDVSRNATCVYVAGDFVYVGISPGFIIFDVSNPTNPIERGSHFPNYYSADISDIYVVDTIAYVAAGGPGLLTVDVSDPDNPGEHGAYQPTEDHDTVTSVQVVDNRAYILNAAQRLLHILDVSNPAAPVEYATHYASFAPNIHVEDDHIYGSNSRDKMYVIDARDPTNPRQQIVFDVAGVCSYVWASDGMAYLATGAGGLQVIDVQDAANPSVAGHYASSGSVSSVSVVNNHAYTGGDGAFHVHNRLGGTQMQVFDVSNPSNPTLQGSFAPLGGAVKVQAQTDTAYAVFQQELFILDVSDPTMIRLRSRFDTAKSFGVDPSGLDVVGNFVYVMRYRAGLGIVDISNPANPIKRGYYAAAEDSVFLDVQVMDSMAYVAVNGIGLLIIDVTDPDNPTLRGTYEMAEVQSVQVVDGLAYVGFQSTLTILDVRDPANPSLRGTYSESELLVSIRDIHVVDDVAYLAADEHGVWLVDVSDPSMPVRSGYYNTPGSALEVQVAGDVIYVADYTGGLQILRRVEQQQGEEEVYLPLIRR